MRRSNHAISPSDQVPDRRTALAPDGRGETGERPKGGDDRGEGTSDVDAVPAFTPLFRQEALDARSPNRLSGAIRVRAPYMAAGAWAASFVVLVLIAFCFFGRLTQLVSAPGTLIPEKSSLKIFSPRRGVLVRSYVTQGRHVMKGEPLFTVSGEEFGEGNVAMLRRASTMIRAHIEQIRKQESLERAVADETVHRVQQQIASAREQVSVVEKSIVLATSSVSRDQDIVDRKNRLKTADIAPITELERAEELLATDQQHLLSSMNNRDTLQRQISDFESELAQTPVRLEARLSELEQQIATNEIELARNEIVREVTIDAPADGTVATDVAFPGQNVTTDAPLMVLDPEGSKLVAQLFVPSAGIGFLKVAGAVSIKYDAYPYQTFGYSTGHIQSIGNVALLPSELQALKIPSSSNEPVFNVIVEIDAQIIETYGHQTPLLPGSTFTAELSGETRAIWQWIFNPLLSIKGNAFSTSGI